MNWNSSLAAGEIKPHQTSRQELDNLRALIVRDLADAAIPALSPDRRFATAYNAALQTAKMLIACSGYRVTARAGHHAVSFQAANLILGPASTPLTDYFDLCRRKRNIIDYDNSSVATETEAAEILLKAAEFVTLGEAWIDIHHPIFHR